MFFKQKPEEMEEMNFMSPVEAAIMARGRRSAYLLSLIVCVMFVGFVVWAGVSELDEVTRGMGQVVPSRKTQVIQNLEGGILEEILVRENQIVNEGDILVRLNNETAASSYRDLASQIMENEAAVARLTAELDNKEPVFSDEIKQNPIIMQGQMSLFEARRNALQLDMDQLQSQLEQKQQELAEMQARKKSLEERLRLSMREQDMAEPLVEKKIYPEMDFVRLQSSIVTLRGDIESLAINIPRAQKAVEESKKKLEQRLVMRRIEVLDEVNKHRIQLQSLRESLAAGQDRVTRTDVRSPVNGTINRIIINTLGGVVRPGEPILEIVPLDDTLLIEARISPADIAFIRPQQKAMIKITAYDFSIYGGLEGVVEQISADTITGEKGENFYRVTLRTNTNTLMHQGTNLPIIPGMMASVDVITGRKTILNYLLKPIVKASQTAMRER